VLLIVAIVIIVIMIRKKKREKDQHPPAGKKNEALKKLATTAKADEICTTHLLCFDSYHFYSIFRIDSDLPKPLRPYFDVKTMRKENWELSGKCYMKKLEPGTKVQTTSIPNQNLKS